MRCQSWWYDQLLVQWWLFFAPLPLPLTHKGGTQCCCPGHPLPIKSFHKDIKGLVFEKV